MKIVSCPKFTHKSLEIRHLEVSDVPDWFDYASNQKAMMFAGSVVRHVDELIARIEKANSNEPGSLIQFAIAEKSGDRLIGTIGFHTIEHSNLSAEIMYDVNPGHWGQGIATAACAAVTKWALSELGWVRVQATALKENIGSIKVLQRCGFEFEGTIRNFRLVDGKPCDFRMYSRVQPQDG